MDSILSVQLTGLRLRNPTILASGILGYSAEILSRLSEGGAGALVMKSVGSKPRSGYANPTLVQSNCGIINAMGLPNAGIDAFAREITQTKQAVSVPVIVSVYGFSADEYAHVAEKASRAGADAIELNVSCPHVKATGSEICQNLGLLSQVIKSARLSTRKPLIVKLTPNVVDIGEVAEEAIEAGADALTISNTVRAMAIDVDTMKPVLSSRIGGLSGPPLKPIALRCVYEAYERVRRRIPIIGCGGISDWRDAVEFMLAGATCVQIGTAVSSVGLNVFSQVSKGIEEYIRVKGFKKVTDIVGLSHRD